MAKKKPEVKTIELPAEEKKEKVEAKPKKRKLKIVEIASDDQGRPRQERIVEEKQRKTDIDGTPKDGAAQEKSSEKPKTQDGDNKGKGRRRGKGKSQSQPDQKQDQGQGKKKDKRKKKKKNRRASKTREL